MRRHFPILLFASLATVAFSAPRTRKERVTGQVLAYALPVTCLNGNAYWSVIVRAEKPKELRKSLVRIDLSLPCGSTPPWVTAKPSIQEFRLYRNKQCDTALAGAMSGDAPESAVPIWKRLDGMSAPLPFGQVVPCYHSADFPPAPVV